MITVEVDEVLDITLAETGMMSAIEIMANARNLVSLDIKDYLVTAYS